MNDTPKPFTADEARAIAKLHSQDVTALRYVATFRAYADLVDENERLRAENARLSSLASPVWPEGE
jgi:hypothetical protein